MPNHSELLSPRRASKWSSAY